MAEGCARRGMDKRKVCVFLILIAVALLCFCVLMYTLFYARPHSNSTLKDGGHGLVQRDAPGFPYTFAERRSVRS
jgi:hypothetical protein